MTTKSKPVKSSTRATASAEKRNTKPSWKPTRIAPFGSLLLVITCMVGRVQSFIVEGVSSRSISSLNAVSDENTLGFLSFDLDDTLFPTSQVVHDANQAQFTRMNEILKVNGQESTQIDGDSYRETTLAIRQGLTAPITYTDLRKRAIQAELAKYDIHNRHEECFQVWLDERQRAADRNLFPQVISTLQQIQRNYPDVCIAAITNGRGNPLDMPSLAEFFDFCVSGEDDGVFPHRKPHAKIYQVARARHPTGIWIHVGDCLANDVGASADMGAYAVWYHPETADRFIGANQPSWSTASSDDIARRQELAGQAEAKVATRISEFAGLVAAIDELVEAARLEAATN